MLSITYILEVSMYFMLVLSFISGAVMYNKKDNCDINKLKKACQNWLKQAPNRKQETALTPAKEKISSIRKIHTA